MITSKDLLFLNLMAALFHQQQTNDVAVNIALNKSSSDCSGNNLPKLLLDGNTRPGKQVKVIECDGKSYVEVDLHGLFSVHYVIIYVGGGNMPGQLDYFRVLVNDLDSLVECSEFWRTIQPTDRGLRLNCRSSHVMSSQVRLSSREHGFSVSEIEVYTLASGRRDEMGKHFRGCFRNFGLTTPIDVTPVLPGCQKHCTTSDYSLFGIQENKMCRCANDYDENDEVPIETCDTMCADGISNCGGRGVYSVYLGLVHLPTYRGCFKVPVTPGRTEIRGDMTVDKCLRHCEDYNYALLKNKNNCLCSREAIPENASSEYHSCDRRCSGNPQEYCGGLEYFSVYETCLRPRRTSMKCSKLLKCARSYDNYGLCNGKCQDEFFGEYCLERGRISSIKVPTRSTVQSSSTSRKSSIKVPTRTTVPSSSSKVTTKDNVTTSSDDTCQISDPCLEKVNTVCVVLKGKIECVCKTGYSRIDEHSRCEANISDGNQIDTFKYWLMAAYFLPLFFVLVLFFVIFLYSTPLRTESDVSTDEVRRKSSLGISIISAMTKKDKKK